MTLLSRKSMLIPGINGTYDFWIHNIFVINSKRIHVYQIIHILYQEWLKAEMKCQLFSAFLLQDVTSISVSNMTSLNMLIYVGKSVKTAC